MAKYELSDAQVDNLLALLEEANGHPQLDNELAVLKATLREQKPLQLPTKPWAVIQRGDKTYVLADPQDRTCAWVGGTLGGSWGWVHLAQMPKQFTVISEGLES